jgi:hypothetical protein
VIVISGNVVHEEVLHEYVAELVRSPLVKEVRLNALEKVPTSETDKPTQFTVRLVFRPSHGQPDPDAVKPGMTPAVRVAQGGGP